MLSNLAAQQQPVKRIHELTMNDIQTFMAEQFWSNMKRKPGETIPELASELKFSNAIRVAQEVEEAAKVAKETVHGQPSTSVQKVYHAKSKTSKTQEKKTACFRCGNSGHFSKACPHIKAICSFCRLNGRRIKFEIDSGASDTFCCEATWQTLGKPTLQPVSVQYQVAEGSPLPVVGQFQSTASIDGKSPDVTFARSSSDDEVETHQLNRENLSCAESTTTIEHVTTSGPENSLHAACIQFMWRVSYFI